MAAWLVKSEPSEYSYADLERDGTAEWDGVKNAQAQIHLRAMQVGDVVVVYHSQSDRRPSGWRGWSGRRTRTRPIRPASGSGWTSRPSDASNVPSRWPSSRPSPASRRAR